LVGNTPFTSLHITHCRTTKNYEPERAKKWDDITVRVTLCFGPNENTDHIPAFSIPWKKNVNFKNNRVFIYFPKDGPIRIVGNPQKFWLLSFQIEKSVISSFLKQSKKGWFDDITRHSSMASNRINGNIVFQNQSIKKRKRNTYSSCETITLGYIDLKLPQKKEGKLRSCLHDAFINAGYLLGKNICNDLYKECPPKKYNNSTLKNLLNSLVIQNNFIINSPQNYTKEKGGNEWILLNGRIGTGVYVVWCNVHPTNCRENTKRKKMDKQDQMESHAFVYDSDFDKFEEEKYYGAIIDNREHSNFRAFSAEDIKDVESVRNSLENYFLGKTIIRGWLQIHSK